MKKKDHYFWQAKADGYASRAAYKLQQIQQQERLLHAGDYVLELGAAPGGWTAVIAELVGMQGKVAAVDLEPMQTSAWPQVHFIHGDFTTTKVLEEIQHYFGQSVDLVLSDAAPKTSGIHVRDAARSSELCLAALAVSLPLLKSDGSFLCKIFAGDEARVIEACKTHFKQVRRLKPKASRQESREFYLLAKSLKLTP